MYRRLVIGCLFTLGLGTLLLTGRSATAHYSPIYQDPLYFGGRAKDFTFLKKDGRWYVIAINDPNPSPPLDQPESPGLPVSTSYDFNHWNFQGVAIPHGDTGTWDSRAIWAPTIVQSGDTYYLYYAGVQVVGTTFVQQIGLATSTDLIHWTKSGSNPVVSCGTFSWAYWSATDPTIGGNCRDPYVIRDEANNQWVMFFSAVSTQPYKWIANPTVVGMATSTDLVHWTDAGFIPATQGYTTESQHVFEHNGTWYLVFTGNCSYQGTTKCLVYSTAPSLMGPYTGYNDLPAVDPGAYASEYYKDTDGNEYLAYANSGNIYFDRIDWSGGSFNLLTYPQINYLTGLVWNDLNRNGVQDPGEPGINGVAVHLYQDDGDGIFNAANDHDLWPTVTATRKYHYVWTPGLYLQSSIAVGLNWISVSADNFAPGGPLAGMTVTTGTTASALPVTESIPNLPGPAFGFALPDTTPPAAVQDLAAQ